MSFTAYPLHVLLFTMTFFKQNLANIPVNCITPNIFFVKWFCNKFVFLMQCHIFLHRAPVVPSSSYTGLILGLHPTNERRRYFVTAFLIGWVQAWNQPRLHTISTQMVLQPWIKHGCLTRKVASSRLNTLKHLPWKCFCSVLFWALDNGTLHSVRNES